MDLTHPMDLTVSSQSSASDVIVLSDSGIGGSEGIADTGEGSDGMLTSDLPQRARMIRRLREELRNEDATLVLLKKIRQSQSVQQFLNTPTAGSNGSAASGEKRTPPPTVNVVPPPSKNSAPTSSSHTRSYNNHRQQRNTSDLQNSTNHHSSRLQHHHRNTPNNNNSTSAIPAVAPPTNSPAHRSPSAQELHQNAQQRQVG